MYNAPFASVLWFLSVLMLSVYTGRYFGLTYIRCSDVSVSVESGRYIFGDFPKWFSLLKTLCFLTLELILLSYLLGSLFSEKEISLWSFNHQVVNHPTLCYPSWVEVDLWSGGFVPYPSSERLICIWLCAYPSFVRLILVALCLASKCRGSVCNWERSCVLPVVVAPNPQWRFPVWTS